MAQDIEGNAEAFGNDLKATGHVAVYGILFDTGRSTIKPESAGALGEVARLLTADPALKLFVVGHTDTAGAIDAGFPEGPEIAIEPGDGGLVYTAMFYTVEIGFLLPRKGF
jgi:hypothetical protein